MSVSGLCQICESQTASHDCTRCGMLVCDDHFREATGLCAECASEGTPGEGGGPIQEF